MVSSLYIACLLYTSGTQQVEADGVEHGEGIVIIAFEEVGGGNQGAVSYTHLDVYKRQVYPSKEDFTLRHQTFQHSAQR